MRWLAGASLLGVILVQSLAPAGSAWTQAGGGPGHSGVEDLPDVLDIIAYQRLAPDGWTMLWPRSSVLETPHGLATIVQREGTTGLERQCSLSIAALGGGPNLIGEPFTCADQRRASSALQPTNLVAYDRVSDLLLYCSPGEVRGPGLHAVRAKDGNLEWAIAAPSAELHDAGPWTCGNVALDEKVGIVYVPFVQTPTNPEAAAYKSVRNRIAAIEVASGSALWSVRAIAAPVEREDSEVPGVGTVAVPTAAMPSSFVPTSITKTANGLLVLGDRMPLTTQEPLLSPAANDQETAFGAYALDGAFQSGREMGGDALVYTAFAAETPAPVMQHSRQAAAQGTQAAIMFGPMIYLVDPLITDVGARFLPPNRYPAAIGAVGPTLWSPDHLVIVLDYFIGVLDAAQGSDGRYLDYQGLFALDGVLDGRGDGHFLFQQPGYIETPQVTGDPNRVITPAVISFDLDSGARIARLLPAIGGDGDYASQARPGVFMTAIGHQLLVWTSRGDAAVLGSADDDRRPRLQVSNAYPALGERFAVDVEAPGAQRLMVAWGNGRLDDVPSGAPLENQYARSDDYEVRITSVFADNTTATSVLLMHPGRTPPARLTWMQEQFSAENQERTYFVLGLLFTLAGAIYALMARRRSQSRIHTELAVLDQIAQQGRKDPTEARRDLDDFERDLRKRLASGSLRDTQYDILDRRARDVRRDLGAP